MLKNLIINKSDGTDIIPLFVGYETCRPGHSYGPHIRDYFLIHYCVSGRGVFYNELGEHRVRSGELFVIRPGELTTYVADTSDPWGYVWIAFRGEHARAFAECASVLCCDSEPFLHILELINSEECSSDIYSSIIYDIIYRLFSEKERESDAPSKIRKFIKYNYMTDITASGVAAAFGYERSYLYRIFKKRYGVSIKEYITKVRMDRAHEFLSGGHTVAETAALTGYKDEFNFSRAYKSYFGYPPSHTRRML